MIWLGPVEARKAHLLDWRQLHSAQVNTGSSSETNGSHSFYPTSSKSCDKAGNNPPMLRKILSFSSLGFINFSVARERGGEGGNAKQIIMCYELSTHKTYPFFKRLLTSLSLFGDHRYNFKHKPKLHRDIELNTDMPPPFSCANNSRITYPTYLIWPYNHRISFILKATITKSGW